MAILAVSGDRHRGLRRFRRNTWKAIALCAALRLADSTFGLGLFQPAQSLAAQEVHACPIEQEFLP